MIHLHKYPVLIVGSLSLLLLASCSGAIDEQPDGALPEGKYPLLIGGITLKPVENASRAVETEAGTSWADGDKIHLLVTQNAEIMTTECTLDAAGNVTDYSPQLYWKSALTAEVKAWHFAGSGIDAATGNGNVTVEEMQTVPLLAASTTASWANGDIRLNFSHATAKVTVNVGGELAANVTSLEIRGDATATMAGGVLTQTADVETKYIPMTKLSDASDATGPVFIARLFPSAHAGGMLRMNGKNEVNVADLPLLEAGKSYIINLTAVAPTVDVSALTADYTVPLKAVLTGTTTHKITLKDGAEVTLKNFTLTGNSIICSKSATIMLSGKNTITEGSIVCGAGKLTINGTDADELSVTTPDNVHAFAAGIGSATKKQRCGDIEINGGKLTIVAHNGCAGIGSGQSSFVNDIIINGGVIDTKSTWGCGIGSGRAGGFKRIIINNCTELRATGQRKGCGIGCGADREWATCEEIIINGGVIYATAGEEFSAGIGAGPSGQIQNGVTITGGTIYACGTVGGAGIGTGRPLVIGDNNPTCPLVAISGGNITVVGVAGAIAPLIGQGSSASTVAVSVTGGNLTLDNSAGGAYFDPAPNPYKPTSQAGDYATVTE